MFTLVIILGGGGGGGGGGGEHITAKIFDKQHCVNVPHYCDCVLVCFCHYMASSNSCPPLTKLRWLHAAVP